MEKSQYYDINGFESSEEKIKRIVRELEDELELQTRKTEKFQNILILICFLTSVPLISGMSALSLSLIQQNLIN